MKNEYFIKFRFLHEEEKVDLNRRELESREYETREKIERMVVAAASAEKAVEKVEAIIRKREAWADEFEVLEIKKI